VTELLTWTPDLSVGIGVIDRQHQRIVDYINMLHDARLRQDSEAVAAVLNGLVDYTLTHFSFEEALLAEAQYRFATPHKKVHELFIRRIGDYQQRFARGEDLSAQIQAMLAEWLIKHIKHEDMDYAATVRASLGAEKLK
jgi:hemerythrin